LEKLLELKNAGHLPKDARQFERKALATLPKVRHNVYRVENNELKDYRGLNTIPRRFLGDKAIKRTESYIRLSDLIKYVARHHPHLFDGGIEVNLSADGVPEATSGSKTLHVIINIDLLVQMM
jgi:hypothetical protein